MCLTNNDYQNQYKLVLYMTKEILYLIKAKVNKSPIFNVPSCQNMGQGNKRAKSNSTPCNTKDKVHMQFHFEYFTTCSYFSSFVTYITKAKCPYAQNKLYIQHTIFYT